MSLSCGLCVVHFTMIITTAPDRQSIAVSHGVVRPDVRPLQPGDGLEIRRLFRATVGLRRPHAIEYADLVGYERLCLDWYLTVGRADARVLESDGEVVGYLLVCVNQPAYDAWARRRAARWAGRAAYRLATGQLSADARRFAVLHIRDARVARRLGNPPPFPAHAHLHVPAGLVDDGIGHRLVAAVDEIVELAGLCGWYGEVDVPAGGSLGTFERDGVQVVHRVPNETYSWIRGTPVHRVTVARSLEGRPPRVAR